MLTAAAVAAELAAAAEDFLASEAEADVEAEVEAAHVKVMLEPQMVMRWLQMSWGCQHTHMRGGV